MDLPRPLSTTATALSTGLFTDLAHSVTVVAGDLINLTVDQSTGGQPQGASASASFHLKHKNILFFEGKE